MEFPPSGLGVIRGRGKPMRQSVSEVSRSAVRKVREDGSFQVPVQRPGGHALVIRVRGQHEDGRSEYVLYRLPRVSGKGRLYEFYRLSTWHIFLPSRRRNPRIPLPLSEGSRDEDSF